MYVYMNIYINKRELPASSLLATQVASTTADAAIASDAE